MSVFAGAGGGGPQLGEKIAAVKGVCEHVLQYIGLALYTAVGAKVYHMLHIFGISYVSLGSVCLEITC